MGKSVKVKSVVEADPDNPQVNPILVQFEHAAVNPNLNGSLDLNKVFGAAVFVSDTASTSSRDMSHLNRSAFQNRSIAAEQGKFVLSLLWLHLFEVSRLFLLTN